MLNIIHEPELKSLTSLGLGGKALALLSLHSFDDAYAVPEAVHKLGGQPCSLGRGSNILAHGNLPLVLVRADFSENPHIVEQNEQQVKVEVKSGFPLPRLVIWAATHGLAGLEGLAGVPGQVGGALAMNAGSFGSEIGNLIESLTIYSLDRGFWQAGRDEFEIKYRSLSLNNFTEWYLICGARLVFEHNDSDFLLKQVKKNLTKKKATQPVKAKSAGCVFKNPPQNSAGLLLDQAGLKGYRLGDMGFSDLHANFLVNYGQGESEQALELISLGQKKVKEKFGIDLQTEVMIWHGLC